MFISLQYFSDLIHVDTAADEARLEAELLAADLQEKILLRRERDNAILRRIFDDLEAVRGTGMAGFVQEEEGGGGIVVQGGLHF